MRTYSYILYYTILYTQVLSPEGTQCPPNTQGALAIKLPLPPGCMTTLYNNNKRYIRTYFERLPAYYDTGTVIMCDYICNILFNYIVYILAYCNTVVQLAVLYTKAIKTTQAIHI